MKTNIHPRYYSNARVICACGNQFITGSTVETIHVELCHKCHPFYTGEQKFVDAASLIDKFEKKRLAGKTYVSKKAKKQQLQEKTASAPKTLREMLESLK